MIALLLLLDALAAATALLRPHIAELPLNLWPMLQTHDAATGYLNSTVDFIDDIVVRFAKTQSGNVTTQLECGARSFDWRPFLSATDGIVFAHGQEIVNHSMRAAAAEVVAWANAHAADQEDALVLLIVADCNGGACNDAAEAAFLAEGLRVQNDCGAASDWTVAAAMSASAMAGGGHAVALMNCPSAPVNTYDDRLSCTGFFNVTAGEVFEAEVNECLSSAPDELQACIEAVAGILDTPDHYACYADGTGANATTPFERLLAWNAAVAAVPPPTQRGLLTSLQGCWAQNVQSTILSFLHNSSLLGDEVRSNFNSEHLLAWVALGNASHPPPLATVNLVGVNNVCNGGMQLLAEIRKRIPPAPASAVAADDEAAGVEEVVR